ncbi:cytochrome C oxidase subunit IV family protein [Rhodocaloribacter litoris]|uniref:cytochrome C oxidase subunit IV family protein n=1 Tax=Rhodocaloribacter litoris TaxID=2558931 RepID=UPI00141E37F4|nr:cytochrome C oxidase subunit IV family protein [Rhodocaloribacter litoris]QXD15957.1 cytochrome C oxidase subunit IV family protein [Rhodocaloribacter litoris]
MSDVVHHGHHHIVPKKVLLAVFGALIFLTVITVLTARLDLGALNVPVALAIAGTKAALVVAYFMALKYDNRVNLVVMLLGIIFVVIFLTFTLFDTAYRGDLSNVDPQTIADQQRQAERLLAAAGGGGAATGTMTGEDETARADTVDAVALLNQYMCTSCHAIDSPAAMVGPSLYDVGSRLSEEEIRQSIMEPDAVVAEGYAAGVMGATLNANGFYDNVTPEELDALVAYLAARTGN